MTYYLVIFAAGFAGSFHCIGMCGGFACALGRDPRGGAATVERHLLYNVGRLTTYCFLGALAGALGEVLCTSQGLKVSVLSGSLDTAQRFLAITAGLLMIVMALQFFGLLQGFHRVAAGFGGSTLAASLRNLLKSESPAAPDLVALMPTQVGSISMASDSAIGGTFLSDDQDSRAITAAERRTDTRKLPESMPRT
mgnify:CR=1 FL=1